MSTNPVVYFEIPASDLARAARFYAALFEVELEHTEIDGHPMALFPFSAASPGIMGALVTGESYTPSEDGTRVYFHTSDIEATLNRAVELGGEMLYPRKSIGELGYVAEFRDSEGNRIALHQPAQA